MNSFIAAYNRAPALSIFGAYKNPSKAKILAERAVLREMTQRNGWGYKVINHTCQHFTAVVVDYDDRYPYRVEFSNGARHWVTGEELRPIKKNRAKVV